MDYTVTSESFDSLKSYWKNPDSRLRWSSVFVLPAWLEVWWHEFHPQAELYLAAVRQGTDIIGIAPLQAKENRASFIGDVNVCDYSDFVVALGREADFFNVLLDDMRQKGVGSLDLRPLRPESTVLTHLAGIARGRGYDVLTEKEDVSVELDLPATWDGYLEMLDKKQRHEVKRKLRRLWEAGNIQYRCAEARQGVGEFMDTFLKLFSLSREEKADFMTPVMESFFRSLAEAMAEIGLLRFGMLELEASPVAMTMGFDYNDSMFLYNSAYDPQYDYLSVGVLSKVLCIKDSIQIGRKKWDFLKGGEPYKYHLGGKEVTLYNCRIEIR